MDASTFDAVLLDLESNKLDVTSLRKVIFPSGSGEPASLDETERQHLALTLKHTAGNKRKAAHLLGISRSTLLNKVRKYGLAGLALTCWSISTAHAQTRGSIPSGKLTSGTLSFDGHATVGDFVGTTDSVSGQMTGGATLAAVRGWVEAPVTTLKTGDRKRDKDLNKSMESNKYPTMRFELMGVSPSGGTSDSLGATLHGNLTIHGVTRKVDLPSTLLFRGPSLRVKSDFPLNLKDYRIGGLSKMLGILKMSEKIEVHADLQFGLEHRT